MAVIDRGLLMLDYLRRLGTADTFKAKYESLADAVDNAPALDVAPVVHARWIRDDLGNTRCSNCHTRLPFRHCYDDEDGYEWDDEIDETPWCMHCGARMDGEEDAAD